MVSLKLGVVKKVDTVSVSICFARRSGPAWLSMLPLWIDLQMLCFLNLPGPMLHLAVQLVMLQAGVYRGPACSAGEQRICSQHSTT